MSVDIDDIALNKMWALIVKSVEKASEGIASKVEFNYDDNQIKVYWKGGKHLFGGNHALIIDLSLSDFYPESNYYEDDDSYELTGTEYTWGANLSVDLWFCVYSDNKYMNPLFFDELGEQIDYLDRVAMPFAHEESVFSESLSVIKDFFSSLGKQLLKTNVIIENDNGIENILSKSFGYVFKNGKAIEISEYFNKKGEITPRNENKCWQPKLPAGVHNSIKSNAEKEGSNLKVAYHDAVEQFLISYENSSVDYFASRSEGSEQSIWISSDLSNRLREKAKRDGVSGNRVLYTAIINYHNNLEKLA